MHCRLPLSPSPRSRWRPPPPPVPASLAPLISLRLRSHQLPPSPHPPLPLHPPPPPPQICPLHRPPLPRRRHCRPTPRSRSGGHGPPTLHKYSPGEPLSVKVNSLTSIDTEIPYSYYSLPFCAPPEGVKDSAENLGELLMGDRIESTPYPFRMHANESDVLLCRSSPLDAMSFSLLKRRIDEMYQVNLILDNLLAIRYTRKDDYFLRWTGYPVGIPVPVDYYVVELGRTDRDNRSEGAATFSLGTPLHASSARPAPSDHAASSVSFSTTTHRQRSAFLHAFLLSHGAPTEQQPQPWKVSSPLELVKVHHRPPCASSWHAAAPTLVPTPWSSSSICCFRSLPP